MAGSPRPTTSWLEENPRPMNLPLCFVEHFLRGGLCGGDVTAHSLCQSAHPACPGHTRGASKVLPEIQPPDRTPVHRL